MSKLDKIKKALEDAVKDKKGMYWETATQALKDLEELREEMEGLGLRSHASTGQNSFVTRLQDSLKEPRGGKCSVSPRDLNDILHHFIRLDDEARNNHLKEVDRC